MKKKTFHLGLSLAGAVSAGAYTAGFMDYLLEALNNWQKAKEADPNDTNIPQHDVIIDTIGGASAGGMVSMITALALCKGKIEPVRKVSNVKTGNILYDSWVFLDDDIVDDENKTGKTTFEKMLDLDDIIQIDGASSLLNSKPIDNIAEKVFNELPLDASTNNFPPYISKKLSLILTLTSLRPLDYTIKLSRIKSKFLDFTPGHKISNHDLIAHFNLGINSSLDDEGFLPFRPLPKNIDEHSNRELLIKVTKATGAFPVGLAPRHFGEDLSMSYVRNNLKKRKDFNAKMDIEFESTTDSHFKFTAVDGGALNNEPFDEVLRDLVERHGEGHEENPLFGTLLIDPFPNFEDRDVRTESLFKTNMIDIIASLIPTILNQARNKRSDTFSTDLFKIMAFPRKYELGQIKKALKYPLATGGIGGFGGFMDIEFRKHDYFLGRDNAKNFLRWVFLLECKPQDKENLFYGVHQDAIEKFGNTKDGVQYMPIIPDLSRLDPNDDDNPTRFEVQKMPKFDSERFKSLKKPINNRIKAIVKVELNNRISGLLWWIFKGIAVKNISKKITNWVMNEVEADFMERGM